METETVIEALPSIPSTEQTIPPEQPASNPAIVAAQAVQRKRGRHPNTCNCEKCQAKKVNQSVPVTGAQSSPAAPVQIVTQQDRDIAKQTILAITHSADAINTLVFSSRCERLKVPEAHRSRILEKVPFNSEIREGVATTGVQVAEKYGIVKVMPEIGLASYLSAHIIGLTKLFIELGNIYKDDKPTPQKQPNTGNG